MQDDENDEKFFKSIIDELNYPKCPKCGSTEIAVTQHHAACLKNCGWVGDSSTVIKTSSILKSLHVSENFFNLINLGKNSIKHTAHEIAKERGLPGAESEKAINVARVFIPQIDDFGDETNISDYLYDRAIKIMKLHIMNGLDRVCHLCVGSNMDRICSPRSIIFDLGEKTVNEDTFLDTGDQSKINEKVFLKKSIIDSKMERVNKGESNEIVNATIYGSFYGRPDAIYKRSFNKYGGYIKDGNIDISFSDRMMIWQPFYWPAINFSNSNTLRLAGVMQVGQDNLTYVVNECLDTGQFNAGVYKRDLYTNNINFIQSKAEDTEDAIRRIRTSFEKTIVSCEESNTLIDFFWIKDWGYENNLDKTFSEIILAPFWLEAIHLELLHLIGYTKEQLLDEMAEQIKQYQ
jgi:hypothetical protein